MKQEQKQKMIDDMYVELTNPIKRQEAQRKARIKKQLSNKKKDTGLI